jgi:hypothetical protein
MNPHHKQVLASWPAWLTVVLLCVTSGCSTFNRAWREAGQHPVRAKSIEGRWEGRWLSEVNGHNGKLRCLISRQPDGDYSARFRATYLKVLRFSYTVTLRVEPGEGEWRFHGEANLGKMAGGNYRYAGRATQTEFHSTFDSQYDRGTFEMRRIGEAAQAGRP